MDSKHPQVLNIVGEQVSLLPTGLPKSEPFLIDFDAYYKPPELNETEVQQLKEVLIKVFRKSGAYFGSFSTDLMPTSYADVSGVAVKAETDAKEPMKGGQALDLSGALTQTADMIVDTSAEIAEGVQEASSALNPFSIFKPKLPLPPCNDEEKSLLLKSLKYRFSLLREEITFQRERDSIDFRNAMDHAFRLRDYIEFVEKGTECAEDEEEYVEFLELDDDRIKTLLRQFIFLVLQGQNPLKGYEGVDPGPGAFVQRLEDHAISDFNKYIKDYRDENHTIPPRIAEVMKATDLDINAIQQQIDFGVKKQMYMLLQFIQQRIPPGDPFWVNVNKGDMKNVIDALLNVIMAQKDEIKRLRDELNTKQNQVIALEALKRQCEEEKESLKERIKLIQGEVEAAKTLANSKGTNSASLNAALENANKEISGLKANIVELQEQKKKCDEEKVTLQATIDQLRGEIAALQSKVPELESAKAELEKLREANTKLQEDLAAAKKDCEGKSELTARITDLQQQLETAKADASDLEGQLSSVRAKCDEEKKELLKEIDDLKTKIAGFETEQNKSDDLNAQIADLQSQLTALETKKASDEAAAQEKIAALEAELERVKKECAGLPDQIRELNNQLAERDASLAKALEEIKRLTGAVMNANDAFKKAQAEIAALTGKLRAAEKRVAELLVSQATSEASHVSSEEEKDEKLKKAEEEQETLRGQLTTAQEEFEKLKKEKERLEADLAKAKAKIAELEKLLLSASSEIARLRASQASLKASQASSEQETAEQLRKAEKREEELTQQLNDAKTAAATSEEERDNLAKLLEEARAKITELEALLSAAQARIAALEAAQVSSGTQASEQAEQLKQAGVALQAAQEQVEAIRSELGNKITSLEGQLKDKTDELEREKNACKETIDKLKAEIDDLKRQLESSSSELSGQGSVLSTLQAKLKTAEEGLAQKDTQLSELAALRKQIQDANKRINDLIKLREGDLKRFQAELAAKEEAMRKECEEKTAAEVARIQQEFQAEKERMLAEYNNALQQRDATIANLQNQLAASQTENQTLRDKILSIVESIDNKVETLELTENTSDTDRDTLQPLITSINRAIKERRPSMSVEEVKKEKAERQRTLCYLVFFASYTMNQYFSPTTPESERTVEKIVKETLYGVFKGPYIDVEGYYLVLEKITKGNLEKELLDMFIKILRGLEGETKNIFTLFADQVNSIKQLQLLVPKILNTFSKEPGFINNFDNMVHRHYREHRGNTVNPAENLYLKYSESDNKVIITEKEDGAVLSYPFLFYIFLFITRDYLRTVERSLEQQCPLPTILMKDKDRPL